MRIRFLYVALFLLSYSTWANNWNFIFQSVSSHSKLTLQFDKVTGQFRLDITDSLLQDKPLLTRTGTSLEKIFKDTLPEGQAPQGIKWTETLNRLQKSIHSGSQMTVAPRENEQIKVYELSLNEPDGKTRIQETGADLILSLGTILRPQTYYSARPDITSVRSKSHPELTDLNWKYQKSAHVETAALLLGAYPEHEIYFLARDGELFYDVARALLFQRHEEKELKRIHLLNVSRMNKLSRHLLDYLRQEGISEDALKSGKKFLFFDSGLVGSIPIAIAKKFPEQYHQQFDIHLIHSIVQEIPSTRQFLWALEGPSVVRKSGDNFGHALAQYELMTRFMNRSNDYGLRQGVWVPTVSSVPIEQAEMEIKDKYGDRLKTEKKISQIASAESIQRCNPQDGEINPKLAVAYMEDLKAYTDSTYARNLFTERRKFWRDFHRLAYQSDLEGLKKHLQELMHSDVEKKEAILQDAYEIFVSNYRDALIHLDLDFLGRKHSGWGSNDKWNRPGAPKPQNDLNPTNLLKLTDPKCQKK